MFNATKPYYYSIETAQLIYKYIKDLESDVILKNFRLSLKSNLFIFEEQRLDNNIIFKIKNINKSVYESVNIIFNSKELVLMIPMSDKELEYESMIDEWLNKAYYDKALFGIPIYMLKIWEGVPNLPEDLNLAVINFMSREQFEIFNTPSEKELYQYWKEIDEKYNL